MMKYVYETLEIEGMTISEAIVALQAWKDENPDAVNDYISVGYDGDCSYIEAHFQRPMNEIELGVQKIQEANHAAYIEQRDREEYDRLKAKFEGN